MFDQSSRSHDFWHQPSVDLINGEHLTEPFISLNPNGLVPVLVDDDLTLTEGSAILKYLADKFNLPLYPKELKHRAKVNEVMDWFNANFYKDFAHGLVYPQIFPSFKRPNDTLQSGTIEWGRRLSMKWLKVLNDHILGSSRDHLAANTITIADYFGAAQLTTGELIGCRFGNYPNVERWINNLKNLSSWTRVNESFYGLGESMSSQKFITI